MGNHLRSLARCGICAGSIIHDRELRGQQVTLGRLGVLPFIGERVINHSKDVLEETYDLWDYFDEKRDALERLETYLLRLRDSA